MQDQLKDQYLLSAQGFYSLDCLFDPFFESRRVKISFLTNILQDRVEFTHTMTIVKYVSP